MKATSDIAQRVIILLQRYIEHLGFQPLVHFELEGCCQFANQESGKQIDFQQVSKALAELNIDGELVPEYWKNQWEYVSQLNGQTPLKEAKNLALAIEKLPSILARQGITNTHIKPVVWSGDTGKLAEGCDNVFSHDARAVHIPNAVQINISAIDSKGNNIIPQAYFGEYLQQCFIKSSLACCLLYLPEEEAFERLALKSRYGLSAELCSPINISGGHQGSIALYKEVGKHNQKMGLEPLLVDKDQQVILSRHNWRKTARIEHRLGASSRQYNPYVNVAFALVNLIQALEVYQQGNCRQALAPLTDEIPLPQSLYDNDGEPGAISLFAKSNWFSERINRVQSFLAAQDNGKEAPWHDAIGEQLKQSILADHRSETINLI